MSKKDMYYTKLMDVLELIHAENVVIIMSQLQAKNTDPEKIKDYTDDVCKRFDNIRKDW